MFINTHNYSMKKKTPDYDNTVLSLRLESSEAVRFWKIMDAVKKRQPYANKSDVIRELLGLTKPLALTIEEIEYFRYGKNVIESNVRVYEGNDIKYIDPTGLPKVNEHERPDRLKKTG